MTAALAKTVSVGRRDGSRRRRTVRLRRSRRASAGRRYGQVLTPSLDGGARPCNQAATLVDRQLVGVASMEPSRSGWGTTLSSTTGTRACGTSCLNRDRPLMVRDVDCGRRGGPGGHRASTEPGLHDRDDTAGRRKPARSRSSMESRLRRPGRQQGSGVDVAELDLTSRECGLGSRDDVECGGVLRLGADATRPVIPAGTT